MAQTPDLTGFEYWFDQADSARIYVDSVPQGPVMEALHAPPLTGLADGSHIIHYRLKDDNGRWSGVLFRPFNKYTSAPIAALRYWSDTVNSVPVDLELVDVTPPVQVLNVLLNIDLCGSSAPDSVAVYYQMIDELGRWSSVFSRRVWVDTVQVGPAQPGLISGPAAIALDSTYTFSVDTVPGASSYVWILQPGWSGNSDGSSVDVTINGAPSPPDTIGVYCVNGCGISDTTWTILLGVGISAAGSKPHWNLFPNPTTGQFTLAVDGLPGSVEVTIFNMTGQQVAPPHQFDAGTPITMDAGGLANGTYIVQWKGGERTGRTLLTVQH